MEHVQSPLYNVTRYLTQLCSLVAHGLSTAHPGAIQAMEESVLGSALRYDIPSSILFECRKDLDGISGYR